MIIRALSCRSPYQRGGVKFDSRVLAWGDGRAMVELDHFTLRRIGEPGLRELVLDPNIELQIPKEPGHHTHTQSGPGLCEAGTAQAAEAKPEAVTLPPVAQPAAGSNSRRRR